MFAARDQLASARLTAPSTSLSTLIAGEGAVNELESAILIVLVGHLISCACWTAGASKDDGRVATTKDSNASNARMELERRMKKRKKQSRETVE